MDKIEVTDETLLLCRDSLKQWKENVVTSTSHCKEFLLENSHLLEGKSHEKLVSLLECMDVFSKKVQQYVDENEIAINSRLQIIVEYEKTPYIRRSLS